MVRRRTHNGTVVSMNRPTRGSGLVQNGRGAGLADWATRRPFTQTLPAESADLQQHSTGTRNGATIPSRLFVVVDRRSR